MDCGCDGDGGGGGRSVRGLICVDSGRDIVAQCLLVVGCCGNLIQN